MEHSLHRIGRNFYEADNAARLPPEMDRLIRVLPGFQTEVSFKKFQGKAHLVVNIDTLSKVISQENVLSVIKRVLGIE